MKVSKRRKASQVITTKAKAVRKRPSLKKAAFSARSLVSVSSLRRYFASSATGCTSITRTRVEPTEQSTPAIGTLGCSMTTDDDYRREFGSALYRSLFFRRQLSYKAQQMIVFRRYGSLRSFRRPLERICDISRDLRVAPSTVYQVL